MAISQHIFFLIYHVTHNLRSSEANEIQRWIQEQNEKQLATWHTSAPLASAVKRLLNYLQHSLFQNHFTFLF